MLPGNASLPAALLVALLVSAPVARAQSETNAKAAQRAELPVAVMVFRAAPADASLHDLATAYDPVLLAEVGKRLDGKVVAQNALDLPATQLALDCVAQSPDCLRSVARACNTRALIAPTIERAGTEVVVSLLYFADGLNGEIHHAVRRQRASADGRALLATAPALVDEALSGPTPAAAQAPERRPRAHARPAHREHAAAARHTKWPIAPMLLTGAGVAFLGAGAAFGLAANAAADEHARTVIGSDADVDAAVDKVDTANTQATLSTAGLIVGAVATVAGVSLWVFDADDGDARPQARIAPKITRGGAGVVLEGRLPEPHP